MSLSEVGTHQLHSIPPVPTPADRDPPLHRIKEVRQQQGVSLRRVGQMLHTDIRELRREEENTTDMALSRLYQWQQALDVPVGDLLVDSGAPLSTPVLQRARMVRIMKTVAAIREKAQAPSIQRLADTLVEQILEIMPELKGVNPWHSVGQRRSLDEYGRIVERTYSDELWRDS
ncbi:MAG TPA: helix-turn-helix transcriptional regulator [Pirellulales bacterium]